MDKLLYSALKKEIDFFFIDFREQDINSNLFSCAFCVTKMLVYCLLANFILLVQGQPRAAEFECAFVPLPTFTLSNFPFGGFPRGPAGFKRCPIISIIFELYSSVS